MAEQARRVDARSEGDRRPGPQTGWHEPRTILIALVAASCVIVIAAWGLVGFSDYRETLEGAKTQTRNIANLLEEHALRAIEASDLAVLRARDYAASVGVEVLASSDTAWRRFADMAQNLPQLGSLWIIDADGNVVTSSFQRESLPGNYADRDYFKAHQGGVPFFVGERLVGRATGKPFFSISRTYENADGGFAGLVVAAIHVEYFTNFYRTLNLGPRSVVGIFRRDGAVLALEPASLASPGARFPSLSQARQDGPVSRTFVGTLPVDGVERIVTVREVGEPLIVSASISREAALDDWRARFLRNGLFAAAALLAIGGLAVLGFRSLGRELRASLALRRVSEDLAERVAERTAQLRETNEDLRETVRHRDLLLQEVYHRVKNNLQLLDSLLSIQSRRLTTSEAKAMASSFRLRIQALGLVHGQLMKAQDLATFSAAEFLAELCSNLEQSSGAAESGIAIECQAADLPANLDFAIPVGLMVTELVFNAVKHAFPEEENGRVVVSLRNGPPGKVSLTVADDGLGFPKDRSAPGQSSIGMRIVDGLVAQLEGQMEIRAEGGTVVEITLPKPELVT